MVVSIGWFKIFTLWEMVGNHQTAIKNWLFRVPGWSLGWSICPKYPISPSKAWREFKDPTTPLRKTASFTLALKGPVILRVGFIFCEGNTCLTLIISCEPPPNDLMDSQDSRYQSRGKGSLVILSTRPMAFRLPKRQRRNFVAIHCPQSWPPKKKTRIPSP